MNIFPGYISEGWRGFLQGIDQKPKVVRSCYFSSCRSGPLGEPRGRWGKAAEGSPASTFFQGKSPKAGEAFCRGSTKSRRLSGTVLFRVVAAGHLGSFAVGGKKQLEVVWPEHFFRVNLRRLERLFAGDQPKAEGSLESHFFGSSQRAAWGASRSVRRRRPEADEC